MKTLILTLGLVLVAIAEAFAQSPKLAGRPLSDVLVELKGRGLNIVFSSELVRPEMRVSVEPKTQNLRRILEEILRPHGLAAKEGVKGMLTIVRVRRPRTETRDVPASGTIRGRLLESRTAAGLAAGLVEVESTGQRGTSDADGRFEITAVPSGPQQVLVSMVGYTLVRRDVTVPPSGVLDVDIPLVEGAGTYVESVTVTARAFRDAESGVASQSVLGGRDLLALRGAVADDPIRAVQALPDVMAADDFKSEFAVRGQGLQHLGFSLDGIDGRLLFHQVRGVEDTGSLALINSDILESVSIVAGSRPQRMHANLGAAVDFVTRDGASDRVHVRGLVSATAASTVWEGPAGDTASWLVAARQSYLDWVLRRINPEGTGTFGFTDFQSKLTWKPTQRQTIRALVVGGRSLLYEPDGGGPNSLDTGANHTLAGSVRWRFAQSDTFAISQQVYAVTAGYTNRTPTDFVRQEGSDRDLVWRGAFEWRRGRSRFDGGAQAQHVRATRQARQFTPTGDAVTTLRTSGEATNLAAWLHTSWTVAPGIIVTPGARVDRWGTADAAAVTPWVLAEWQMTPALRWRGGVSVAHQAPFIEQSRLVNPDTTLDAEESRTWDVGVERTFGSDWRASLHVYGRNEDDLLRLIDAEPLFATGAIVRPRDPHWENAFSSHARGAGITLERRTANGLSGWMSYSHDRVTLTDTARSETFAGDFDQRHTFNAYGIYRWSGRTAVSARWRIGSNFPIQGYYQFVNGNYLLGPERNQLRFPLYSRLDLRADRAFTFRRSRLTLFVEVLNVANRTNFGPGDPDVNVNTGRVTGLIDQLFPVLPSAGLILEF
jgi:hypothetical protein